MEMIFDMQESLKKLKKESDFRFLLISAFIAIWIFLETTQEFEAKIITDDFLQNMSLSQFFICCLIQLILLLSRRRMLCSILIKYLSYFLGMLTLADLILFIVTICLQEDPFSQQYQLSYAILGFMFLTVLTIWIQSDQELKIMELQLRMAIQQNEMIRNLLDQFIITQNAEQYHQQEIQQRVQRIQSVDQSQIDPVYGNTCTICNDECDLQEKAVQLRCLHIFHGDCIRQWLLQKSYCPNCRDQVF